MGAPTGSGELRQRVRFERRVQADDGFGNKEGDFLPFVGAQAAKLLPTAGGEAVIAARLQAQSSWDLWVRSNRATRRVQPGDRVIDDRNPDRKFKVAFAQDMDGLRAWILMQLVLGDADG